MAQYTGIYKLYKPDIDDPNTVYVEGFRNTADKIDEVLNTLSTMEVVNPYDSDQFTKKVLTNDIALRWQAHRDSYTGGESSITGDVGLYFSLNPHKITAGQLYDDTLSANIGHNAIVKEINNVASTTEIDRSELIKWYAIDKTDSTLSQIGASNSDRPHSLLDISSNLADITNKTNINTTIDKHVSNKMAFDWETHRQSVSGSINTTLYPDAVVNPHKVKASEIYSEDLSSTGFSALIQELNNATGTLVNWTSLNKAGSNLTDIVTRNHDDLQNIAVLDFTATDVTMNKHISNQIGNRWELHAQSYTGNTDGLAGITTNPHKVTVSQLFDDTLVSTGSNAVVAEINSNATVLLDWDTINTASGNIADIGTRSHQSLQDILGAVLTSTDTTQNRHVSDAQTKKWEEHVDDNNKASANPHNVPAQLLTSSDSTQVGGEAIQHAINNQGVTNGINWVKVSKASSNLTDMVTRNHDDLQTIGELDPTDTDTVKNKHLSNAQGKVFQDHVNTVTGNPHHVTTSEIKGVNFGTGNDFSAVTGGNAIIAELNHNSTGTVDWSVINKTGSNITDISTRNHDDLQNINVLDFSVLDNTKNKHISSIQANKWELHTDTTDGSNPHGVFASSLRSNRSGVSNGGIAIVNAINDFGVNLSLEWAKVNKTGSSILDITNRTHNLLDISLNTVDVSSTSTTQDKHISNSLAKGWEDHRLNMNNPHSVTAGQIGGDNIINEINTSTTSQKINGVRINKDEIMLSELQTHDHSELTGILPADSTASDTTLNRHVSDMMAKEWTDHTNITSGNPHNVQSSEVNFSVGTSSLVGTNVQTAITELDYFKSKSNAGPIGYYATRPEVAEFVGSNLIVKENSVLMYDNEHFEGSVSKFDFPQTTIPIGSGVNEIPNGSIFYLIASQSSGSPVYIVATDLTVANNSSTIPIAFGLVDTASGTTVVYPMARYADGLSERFLRKLMHIDFNERESGLLLQAPLPTNLRFTLSLGAVWRGLDRASLAALSSDTGGHLIFVYKNAGSFVYDTVTHNGAINTQYQGASGLVNLTASNYNACWIYRSLVNDSMYMMVSNIEYPLIQDARTAQPPTDIPDVINKTGIFVGKIITQQGNSEIQEILRPFDIMFTNTSVGFTPTSEHNDLNSIQGGSTTERYHLSASNYTKVSTVELNADVTDKDNVNSSITSYLTSTSSPITTLTDLATKTNTAFNDRVKDTGDTMTGELIMNMSGRAMSIGNAAVSNSNVWVDIGQSSGYKFSMVYTGEESGTANSFELWASRGSSGTGYDVNANGRILRVDQNRAMTIDANVTQSGTLRINGTSEVHNLMSFYSYPQFMTGSLETDTYLILSSDLNKCSAYFGNAGADKNGTLHIRHSNDRHSIIRSKTNDLLIDSYGDINLNTDTTGTHTTTPRVNIGASTKISFNPNGRSLLQNGLSIGGTGITAGSVLDLHGNISMNNNQINEISDIRFNAGYDINDNSSSVLTFSSNSTTENHLHFSASGTTISKIKFSTAGVEFTDGSDNKSISVVSGAVALHNGGTSVASTESYGMEFLSAISIDGVKVEFVNI